MFQNDVLLVLTTNQGHHLLIIPICGVDGKDLYFLYLCLYLLFSKCLMNCMLNFPLHPFPLGSNCIVVKYFHLLCLCHILCCCMVLNRLLLNCRLLLQIYDDDVVKNINTKTIDVKRQMCWCFERCKHKNHKNKREKHDAMK